MRRLTVLILSMAATLAATSPSLGAPNTDIPAKIGAIRYGQTIEGKIDAATDNVDPSRFPFDAYNFTGKAGESIVIKAESSDFDTFVEVFDSSGAALAHDDDGGDGFDSKLSYTLPRDGTYRIDVLASDDTDDDGDYSLSLTGPASFQKVAYGQTIRGRLAAGDEVDSRDFYFDIYKFDGKAGDTVVLTADSSDFDASVYLFGTDDEVLASDDDGGGGRNAKLTFKLPRDGLYRADVLSVDDPDDTGNYTFTIKKQ